MKAIIGTLLLAGVGMLFKLCGSMEMQNKDTVTNADAHTTP